MLLQVRKQKYGAHIIRHSGERVIVSSPGNAVLSSPAFHFRMALVSKSLLLGWLVACFENPAKLFERRIFFIRGFLDTKLSQPEEIHSFSPQRSTLNK